MTLGVYFAVAIISVYLLGHFVYVMGHEAGTREADVRIRAMYFVLGQRSDEALGYAAWALRWRRAARYYRTAYLLTDQVQYARR